MQADLHAGPVGGTDVPADDPAAADGRRRGGRRRSRLQGPQEELPPQHAPAQADHHVQEQGAKGTVVDRFGISM